MTEDRIIYVTKERIGYIEAMLGVSHLAINLLWEEYFKQTYANPVEAATVYANDLCQWYESRRTDVLAPEVEARVLHELRVFFDLVILRLRAESEGLDS